MSDFEDKLNAILSDPESMAQIMQLAQSFSSPASEEPTQTDTADAGFFSALGGIDPGLISKLLPLLQEYGKGQNSETARLLSALQPFLKEERQAKIDKALQIARVMQVAKLFFKSEGGAWHL